MKTMAIMEFKMHALRVLGEVAKSREPIVVTKRGKPLAEIVRVAVKSYSPGKLAETLVFEVDIVSPLGEEIWNASR